jgi:GNAT superfamily N-acetyltransferase
MTTLIEPTTFRRDRFGECWHLVPGGKLGNHGRTLCGEPRQGTRLSETFADIQPIPPECMCPRCTALDVDSSASTAAWLPGASTNKSALDDPDGWYQRALTMDTGTSGARVLSLAVNNLSPSERAETRTFTRHTLDSTDGRMHPFALPADTYTWAAASWCVLVKGDQHVVTQAGIMYRVIQVGEVHVPVGAISGVMTLPDWRGRGYARDVLARASAFVASQLWAPFALVICPRDYASFYEKLGWHVADAPVRCAQNGGQVTLENEVAVSLACQGDASWPSGPIDLCGAPW